MTRLKKLEQAYHLLDDRRRWTQAAEARNAGGDEVDAKAFNAVCWCAGGAVVKVGGSDDDWEALEDAAWDIYRENAINVNDERGYRQIRAVFRRAIRGARAAA